MFPSNQQVIHYSWHTRNASALIDFPTERQLFCSVMQLCDRLKTRVLALGASDNHIHVLVRQQDNVLSDQFVAEVKSYTKQSLDRYRDAGFQEFDWEKQHRATTVQPYQIDDLTLYIRGQRQLHTVNNLLSEWEP